MQTFRTRDGLEIAYHIADFADPWTKPDTMLLLHAAMGNSRRWYVVHLGRAFAHREIAPRAGPHFHARTA